MLSEILTVFWLFLPAGFANMAPVLFKWIPFLNYSIDFGKKFGGKRIFGSHKTIRGFVVGVLAGILITYLQSFFDYGLIDFSKVNFLLLGFLMGFGALFGDAVKSFFKRQLDIKPGKSWIGFDQTDWILGAIVFVNFYVSLGWRVNLIALALFGVLHLLINVIGYLLRVNKNLF